MFSGQPRLVGSNTYGLFFGGFDVLKVAFDFRSVCFVVLKFELAEIFSAWDGTFT